MDGLAWIRWLLAPSSLFIFLLLEIPAKYKSSYGDSELGNYSRASRIMVNLKYAEVINEEVGQSVFLSNCVAWNVLAQIVHLN